MSLFSKVITDFWQAPLSNGNVLYRDNVFTIAINANLEENERLMVLETTDGRVMAVMTPELAEKAGLYNQDTMSESIFRQKLIESEITLHGADHIFYFSETETRLLQQEEQNGDLRKLEEEDEIIFADFQSAVSEQDLDDAYVELDHWVVFGSFDQGSLVCVASVYPWDNAKIADLGVLTQASFRSKGHARKVVRTISKFAYSQGYEPQYRCQVDNSASLALAKASGLTLFGKWELISPDSKN